MIPPLAPAPATLADVEARYAAWAEAGPPLSGGRVRQVRLVADYLRTGLCHLGAEGGRAGPVHVQRILAAVREQLHWLAPSPDRPPWDDVGVERDESEPVVLPKDIALSVLDRLTFLGDCGRMGNGYYLPAPCRRVILPSSRSFVVGCLPTPALSAMLGRPVGWAGLARGAGGVADGKLPEQTAGSWMRLPAESLADRTEQALHRASRTLAESAGLDATAFEIYAPHLCPQIRGQSTRWVQPSEWSPPPHPTVHLCRTTLRPRRFWLAPLEVRRGLARFAAAATVEPAAVRRLMYGIDLRAGLPTKAKVEWQGGDEADLKLYSWPAWEEYRLLTAVAFQTPNANDTPLPFTFRVAPDWWPDVAAALRGLGIVVPDRPA